MLGVCASILKSGQPQRVAGSGGGWREEACDRAEEHCVQGARTDQRSDAVADARRSVQSTPGGAAHHRKVRIINVVETGIVSYWNCITGLQLGLRLLNALKDEQTQC